MLTGAMKVHQLVAFAAEHGMKERRDLTRSPSRCSQNACRFEADKVKPTSYAGKPTATIVLVSRDTQHSDLHGS